MKLIYTLFICLLAGFGGLLAQTGFTAEATDVCPGSNVIVPVTVTNYTGVAGFQFAVVFDPSLLTFQSADPVALTGTAISNFSFNAGEQRLLYTGPAQTLTDGTTAFNLVFTTTATAGTTTIDLTAIATPPPFPAFVSTGSSTTTPTLTDGTVTFGDTVDPMLVSCPADVTITAAAGASTAMVSLTAPTATDNCGMATVTSDAPTNGNYPVGTTTVTYTATDGSNNTTTCQTVVTVESAAPADTLRFLLSDEQAGCTSSQATLQVSVQNYDNVVGWQFSVNWDPAQATYVSSADANALMGSLDLNESDVANGRLSATYVDFGGAISGTGESLNDDVVIFEVTLDYTGTGGQLPVTFGPVGGTIEVTLGGNVVLTPPDVQLIDGSITGQTNGAPVFTTCPTNPIQQSTDVGECGAIVTFPTPTVTDDCDPNLTATQTAGPVSGSLFPVGTTTVEFSATDNAGNTTTCTFDVVVTDNEAPVLTCPTDQTIATVTGACSALASFTLPTATDNCDSVLVTTDVQINDLLSLGTTTVTATATDAVGNTSTCTFDITVEDNEPPLVSGAVCGTTLTRMAAPDSCGATVNWQTPTSSDNCQVLIFASTHDPGDFFPVGTTTVRYVATDGAQNTGECSFDVVVTDGQAPVITGCPADIVAQPSGPNCEATVSWTAPTATDNCGLLSFTESMSSPQTLTAGNYVVEYVATDSSGLETTCSFNITVPGSTGFTFTNCPSGVTGAVEPGTCLGFATWTVPVFNPCYTGTAPTITASHQPNDSFPVGTTTVTYTADDNMGNVTTCTFDVEINDNEAPVLGACPADLSIAVDPNTCTATPTWTAPTATDNCDTDVTVTISGGADSGDPVGPGTYNLTYTATDDSGNVDSCSFVLTVTSTDTLVIIDCPAAINLDNDPGQCGAVASWTPPTVQPNCNAGTATLSSNFSPGDFFDVGNTLVIYVADDGTNTDTCSFLVVVADVEPITISCPANITVSAAPGASTAAVTVAAPVIDNNCGGVNLTNDFNNTTDASGDYPLGTTTVMFVATDDNGQTAVCSLTVEVTATGVLAIDCPASVSVTADAGSCTAQVDNIAVSTTQPGQVSEIFYTIDGQVSATGGMADASGTVFNEGSSTVTYFVVSTANDTLSCAFNVSVTGNNPATLVDCPADQTVSGGGTSCSATVTFDAPTFTGGCGTASIAGPSVASGSSFPAGDTPVSYYLVEDGDTTQTCTFTVTVTGNGTPAFDTCPADMTVSTDAGTCGAVVTFATPTFSGGCGTVTLDGPSVAAGSVFPLGNTVIEYNLLENGAPVATCSFTLTVTDGEAPVFTDCPATAPSYDLPADACSLALSLPVPTATDNCGGVVVSSDLAADSTYAAGQHTITFTATDDAGNSSTCSYTFSVNDVTPPVVLTPAIDVSVGTALDACGAAVVYDTPTFGDACGVTDVTCTPASGSFFDAGTTVVTCTATDAGGNATISTFNVTVTDGQDPTLSCFADVIIAVDGTVIDDVDGFLTGTTNTGCTTVSVTYNLPTAADNCPNPTVIAAPTNPAAGADLTPGNYQFSFAAQDAAANTGSCTVNLTVVADQGPSITANDPGGYCAGETLTLCAPNDPGASYSWTGPQGNVLSTMACVTVADLNAADAGTYTLSSTLANGCDYINAYVLTVGALPEATLILNDIPCTDGNDDLVLEVSIDNNVSIASYAWTGPANFSSGQAMPVIQNATAANAGVYTLVLTTTEGCSATFSESVDVSGTPATPTVQATSQFVCSGNTTILSGTSYTGSNVSYFWTADPMTGAGLPSNTNNFVLQVQPTQAGNYTYSFFADVNGCITPTNSVTINVQDDPAVAISVDGATDCVDGTGSITLTETGGDATGWTWTDPAGNVVSNAQTLVLDNATAAQTGSYTVSVTTDNGCTNSMSEAIVINDQPTALTLNVSNDGFCLGNPTQLFFTPYPAADDVTYTITGLGGDPVTWFDPTYQFVPGAAGVYNVTVSADVDGCTTGTVSSVVTVEDAPELDLEFLGDTDCVEADATVQLIDMVGEAANYTWTYPDGTTATGQVINLTGSDQFGGTYMVVASSSLGCQASASISANLITKAVPPVSIGTTLQPCEDEPFDLVANTDATNVIFQWTGPNSFSTTGQRVTISNPTDLNTGTYQVTATNPATGCSATSADQLVSVLEVPVTNDYFIARQLGVDMSQPFLVTDNDELAPGAGYTVEVIKDVEFGELTLTDPAKGEFTYRYDGTRAVTDNFIYRLCYDDCKEACDMAVATIETRFNDAACVTTDVMSPNGDGVNDNFIVYCIESTTLPQNELLIFNTWGDQVFRAAPYQNDWQGTYNGNDLPDGTYYYLFRRDNASDFAKGFFTIMR